MFNLKESVNVWDFEIWPGFSTAFKIFNPSPNSSLAVLNVDSISKVITNQNVLSIL